MKRKNRLSEETSPYLLQHADNPVAWYPWSEEALATARQQGKPILLSIGYSACHWCHVMAHESFEDEETARLMNRLFISIKVDREERPDLDQIYQVAHTMLARRSGGWPLTMFLDPASRAPFFGGTYFPSQPRHNLPEFKTVLQRVHQFFVENTDDMQKQSALMQNAVKQAFSAPRSTDALPADFAVRSCERLLQCFDPVHGGLGGAPKFPQPAQLEFLLQAHTARVEVPKDGHQPLHAALFTLDKIVHGGLQDHLGGGFFRYSVDEFWMIPHFEKMLYDNAQLLGLLAEAAVLGQEPHYREAALSTASWLVEEMQIPEGGFFAALDADSEGEEGLFYVWDREEVDGFLSDREQELFVRRFGLDGRKNFAEKYHLHATCSLVESAQQAGMNVGAARTLIASAGAKLLAQRKLRVPPGLDDNILCSWNGMVIKGLAKAALLLDRPELYDAARKCLDFVRQKMWRDNRLFAVWNKGRARFSAYLDDYAFLLDGILAMLQYRWHKPDMEFAAELANGLLENYEDAKQGGYLFTPHDGELLLVRPQVLHDSATPAGYGIATLVLFRLGSLCGEPRWMRSAERALARAGTAIKNNYAECITLIAAAMEMDSPAVAVILRGEPDKVAQWQRALAAPSDPARFNAMRMVVAASHGIQDGTDWIDERTAPEKGVRAYVCQGSVCHEPVDNDLDSLFSQLRSLENTPANHQ